MTLIPLDLTYNQINNGISVKTFYLNSQKRIHSNKNVTYDIRVNERKFTNMGKEDK